MPKLETMQQPKAPNKRLRSRRLKYTICAVVLLLYFYPVYLQRLIYPYLYGEPTSQKLEIHDDGFYEDVTSPAFTFTRNNIRYNLVPKTKHSITAKIGYIDNYDTWWNRFYRGHTQEEYINLVPQDLTLAFGQLAKPEVFNLFEFEHEERMSHLLCKNVKYRRSFFSSIISHKQFLKNQENLAKCEPYLQTKQHNNYHPIPATEKINNVFKMLLPKDIIYLEGFLVDVPQMGLVTGTRLNQHHKYMAGGQNPGMCFILYTTKVIFNGRVYQ